MIQSSLAFTNSALLFAVAHLAACWSPAFPISPRAVTVVCDL